MIHFYRREQRKQNKKDLLFIVFHFIHWYNKINFNVCLSLLPSERRFMTSRQTEQTTKTTSQNRKFKDSSAKLIFGDPILCAQFLRGYTDIELLKDVQAEDIEDVTNRFISMWQEERDSDTVKKIHLKNQQDIDTLYLITLIEHQTKVDYDMSFRILRYIVLILTDYAAEAEKKQAGCTALKGFRYPPVLPIVFYDGDRNWTAAKNFQERTALSDLLGEYIPNFQYLVVPLSRYSNQELIEKKDELSLIMLIDKLRSSAEFHELAEIPDDYLEKISRDSPESLLKLIAKIIAAFLHRLNIPKEEIGDFTDQIERRDFTMLFEHFEAYDVQAERAKARAKGEAEGQAKGKARGKADSILLLLSDLGAVPEALRERIMDETDMECLDQWIRGAARASSVEEFTEKYLPDLKEA